MKKIRCIIVDDQLEAITRLEELLLNIANVDVLEKFTNPETAIDAILNKKPDVVFIDIEMPRMTGIEVVKTIRENHFYPTFIFVTAYSHYAISAIKEQAFDYLLKPVNINELKLAINRIISECINHKAINLNTSPLCLELSNREKEVLLYMMNGDTIVQIASKLFISKCTVEYHRKNILSKTESHSFTQLILKLNNIEYSLKN